MKHLTDLWNDGEAARLTSDPIGLLRYRSNLLSADLRTMFPRERVASSLTNYGIAWIDDESTDELRDKLARFYATRTLINQPITPDHTAEAILWLASDRSGRTTGHIIPVDGGLPEAFLR